MGIVVSLIPERCRSSRSLRYYDRIMMVAMPRTTGMLRPGQLGLLLGMLLLAHLGAMALSHHDMAATPVVQEASDLPIVAVSERVAAAPMACPGGLGECMLAWRAPSDDTPLALLVGASILGGVPYLLSAAFTWHLPPYALGPPKRVSPQVLLQVFRI